MPQEKRPADGDGGEEERDGKKAKVEELASLSIVSIDEMRTKISELSKKVYQLTPRQPTNVLAGSFDSRTHSRHGTFVGRLLIEWDLDTSGVLPSCLLINAIDEASGDHLGVVARMKPDAKFGIITDRRHLTAGRVLRFTVSSVLTGAGEAGLTTSEMSPPVTIGTLAMSVLGYTKMTNFVKYRCVESVDVPDVKKLLFIHTLGLHTIRPRPDFNPMPATLQTQLALPVGHEDREADYYISRRMNSWKASNARVWLWESTNSPVIRSKIWEYVDVAVEVDLKVEILKTIKVNSKLSEYGASSTLRGLLDDKNSWLTSKVTKDQVKCAIVSRCSASKIKSFAISTEDATGGRRGDPYRMLVRIDECDEEGNVGERCKALVPWQAAGSEVSSYRSYGAMSRTLAGNRAGRKNRSYEPTVVQVDTRSMHFKISVKSTGETKRGHVRCAGLGMFCITGSIAAPKRLDPPTRTTATVLAGNNVKLSCLSSKSYGGRLYLGRHDTATYKWRMVGDPTWIHEAPEPTCVARIPALGSFRFTVTIAVKHFGHHGVTETEQSLPSNNVTITEKIVVFDDVRIVIVNSPTVTVVDQLVEYPYTWLGTPAQLLAGSGTQCMWASKFVRPNQYGHAKGFTIEVAPGCRVTDFRIATYLADKDELKDSSKHPLVQIKAVAPLPAGRFYSCAVEMGQYGHWKNTTQTKSEYTAARVNVDAHFKDVTRFEISTRCASHIAKKSDVNKADGAFREPRFAGLAIFQVEGLRPPVSHSAAASSAAAAAVPAASSSSAAASAAAGSTAPTSAAGAMLKGLKGMFGY